MAAGQSTPSTARARRLRDAAVECSCGLLGLRAARERKLCMLNALPPAWPTCEGCWPSPPSPSFLVRRSAPGVGTVGSRRCPLLPPLAESNARHVVCRRRSLRGR